MAIHMGNSSESEGIHEINITPFVDIVLVLLIIFMISTPALVYRGLRVTLPKAVSSKDIARVNLNITLSREGQIYLDKSQVTLDQLKDVYKKLQTSKVTSDAIISADKDVPHGKVMEVADVLKSMGIEHVGFATQSARK